MPFIEDSFQAILEKQRQLGGFNEARFQSVFNKERLKRGELEPRPISIEPPAPQVPAQLPTSSVPPTSAAGPLPEQASFFDRAQSAVDKFRRSAIPTPETLEAGDRARGDSLITKTFDDARELAMGVGQILGQGILGTAKLSKDIVTSIPLPGQARRPTASPLGKRVEAFPEQAETVASKDGRKIIFDQILKPVITDIKKSFTSPIEAFNTHPLFTFMDWTMAISLAGSAIKGGVRATGRIAEKTAEVAGRTSRVGRAAERIVPGVQDILSTKRPSLPAGKFNIERKFSTNPLFKFGLQKPLDQIGEAVGRIPGFQEFISRPDVMNFITPMQLLTPEGRAGREANKFFRQATSKAFAKRNERIENIVNRFDSMGADESRAFVPIVQGRVVPMQMTKRLADNLQWWRENVARTQELFQFPEEVTKRIAYQPLAIASGKLQPEDYARALRGDESAMTKIMAVTSDIEKTRASLQEQSIMQFLRGAKKGRPTTEVKNTAREIAAELAPAPIYFPNHHEQRIRPSMFMPTKEGSRFKPGFLKGRTGATGAIEDPQKALILHEAQMSKYLQTEELITGIKDKFAVPLGKDNPLREGWTPFTPDGFIKVFRGGLALQEDLVRNLKQGGIIDDAMADSISRVLPGIVDKTKMPLNVGRPQIFQLPQKVANQLRAQTHSVFGSMTGAVRLIWDAPLAAFKFAALALSPRWVVNNTAGNIILTSLGRVSPQSFIRMSDKEFRALVPREVAEGGFRRAIFPQAKRVVTSGDDVTTKLGGVITGDVKVEGLLGVPQAVVKNLVYKPGEAVFEFNAKVEDFFRQATFIDKAQKAATQKIVQDGGKGIFDMRNHLDRFLERGDFAKSNVIGTVKEMMRDPKFKQARVDDVNRILNDYNNLSPIFERQILRRLAPFWSWWKFMNVTFWTLPIKDPAVAQVLKDLGRVGVEIEEEEWAAAGLDRKEIPPWRQGSLIISQTGDVTKLLNTRGLNPLSTAIEFIGFNPFIDIIQERRTGRSSFTGSPFTSLGEAKAGGRFFKKDPKTGEQEAIDQPTPPPLFTHMLRVFPQLQALEQLMFPYKLATGEPFLSGIPRLNRGRAIPVNEKLKLLQLLGLPIVEENTRRLRESKRAAKQARQKIRRTTRRTQNTLDRLRAGSEK